MRIILFLFLAFKSFGQVDTCYVTSCDTLKLYSTYSDTLDHQWICTDGNTSSDPDPTFIISGNTTCVLTVNDYPCIAIETVHIVNCPDLCELTVDVSLSGNNLITSSNNCFGTPFYQWYKKISGIWTAISPFGNWSYYNTLGISGDYKVEIECEFGCGSSDSITYTAPCNNLTIINYYQNQVVETGFCNSFNSKTYNFYQESYTGAGDWTLIHTATTNNVTYAWAGPGAGSFKVEVTGCGCTVSKLYNNTPCGSFVASTTVPTGGCIGSTVFFSSSSTGGGVATVNWFINYMSIPGPSYVFPSEGTYAVQANFTTSNGCTAVVTKNITITDCCGAENSVSASSPTACTGQNITFTSTPISGTAPYYHQWSYKLGSGSWIGAGFGTPLNISFPTSGTYLVRATMNDAIFCETADTTIVTITDCTDCNCTPSLAFVDCELVATFTGAGCLGANYFLQHLTDSWDFIQSGSAANFTFDPTLTGLYRIVRTKSGCANLTSNIVNVSTCCTIESTVTPTSLDLCTNEFFSINGNYSGNQGAVTFAWTASRNGEPEVFLGTDQTLINVFSLSGTYTIVFTVTDANGCQSQNTVIADVRVCTNCFCSATLTQGNGCTLYGLFIGAGCSNFEYQLQYSATGTGWSTVLTGIAGNGSNFLSGASENGFYRLVVNSEICAGFTTPIVTIDCVQECGCDTGLITDNGCQLLFDENQCDGYLATLQVFISPNWEFASFESPYEYPVDESPDYYRILYQKAGCEDIYSDSLFVPGAEYEFTVTPVSPAPLGYLFDRDFSTDPVLYDLVPDCEPNNGYILGGTSNTWDINIVSNLNLNWSYTHYDAAISGNIFEVSRTSNSIRFQVKGAWATCGCGAQPPIPSLCGTVTVNAMLRLIGKDECDNVIFDRILLKYLNN